MNKVTVITIIESHSEQQQNLVLTSNLSVSGHEYDLLIAVNGSHVPPAFDMDFLQPKECWCYAMELSRSELLNKMLQKVNTQMVCIMPTDLYLDVNWLSEMVVYNSFIERSGIGIISAEKQGYYTNLLTTGGDLEYLAVPDLAGVRGCLFFDQSLITSLGAFNEGLHSGWQFTDYAERAGRCGYNNYFIPMKNAVPVDMVKIEPWHTTEQQYKAAVKKLPLFIKLSDFDSTLELAFKAAEKLVDAIYVTLHLIVNEFQVKVELIENRNNNNFMLRLPVLTERELNLISKFAERHNVKWFVRSDDQFVLCVFTNKNQ